MTMSAREFVERLNSIKASVKAGEATPEIERDLHAMMQRFRDTLSAEEIKSLLASDGDMPTLLEEDMTTLSMTWMRHRGASA